MKHLLSLFIGLFIALGSFAQVSYNCNDCEIASNLSKSYSNYDKSLWDIQLDVSPTVAFSPATNLAGATWTGSEFWVAKWASNEMFTANNLGAQTSTFSIPGVTGCRSITTDGTDMFIGAATTVIYRVHKTTKALLGTINTSVPNCRYITYDPTLNGNAGGFWCGQYASNIVAVSMTGATLSTITAGTHGLSGIYGMAYDGLSSGGPYLWAFDQGGNGADIVQLTIAGVPTGLVHDATIDLAAAGIAGGLFITSTLVPGKNTIGGLSQGASLFAYELSDPPLIDVKMETLNILKYVATGPVTIAGTIRNLGLNLITSVDISWSDGGPAYNQTFSVNIPTNGTYNFSHGTTLATTLGNNYNICVDVSLIGDSSSFNNQLCEFTTALTAIPVKTVVGEIKTGTWCGWVPRGTVGISYMEAEPNFIGIAVHNGSNDPMKVTAYDANLGTYIPGGYPGGGVDRVIDGDPGSSSFLAMYNQRKQAIVPCNVKNIVATYNNLTGLINVSADSEWYGNIAGDFRMSCVIVEDNLLPYGGGQWDMVNYYSGGGNGQMQFPSSINNDYNFGANPGQDPASPILWGGYDYVARSLSNNQILGDVGSLPANIVPIGVHNYSFSPLSYNTVSMFSNSYAVVMVIDVSTGEILNAGRANMSFINSTEELETAKFMMRVYPNPTTDVSNISFNLAKSNNVGMEVYNSTGSLVNKIESKFMSSGKHQFSFNGNELPNGIYFINLTIGYEIITKKIIKQ